MEKMTKDDYPSVNEYYDTLLGEEALFIQVVPDMDEQQLIELYEYVMEKASRMEENEENRDYPTLFAKSYLESLVVIQVYLNDISCDVVLSQEEQAIIENTVQLLEERRRGGPLKSLLKYFRR